MQKPRPDIQNCSFCFMKKQNKTLRKLKIKKPLSPLPYSQKKKNLKGKINLQKNIHNTNVPYILLLKPQGHWENISQNNLWWMPTNGLFVLKSTLEGVCKGFLVWMSLTLSLPSLLLWLLLLLLLSLFHAYIVIFNLVAHFFVSGQLPRTPDGFIIICPSLQGSITFFWLQERSKWISALNSTTPMAFSISFYFLDNLIYPMNDLFPWNCLHWQVIFLFWHLNYLWIWTSLGVHWVANKDDKCYSTAIKKFILLRVVSRRYN